MVLVEGKKYSCETCIKGHRSSNCKHSERPLFEIQKKGRPPTQCTHCRNLRKTRQVHVKCKCASTKDETSKKGNDKILETPAFPNGLGASALASAIARSTSTMHSESDSAADPCACDDDGQCACCVPRKSAPRVRKRKNDHSKGASRASPDSDSSTSSANATLPRSLLPRVGSQEGPLFAAQHGHEHGFSPYGHAYEVAHPYIDGHSKSFDMLLPKNPVSPADIVAEQLMPPTLGSFCACGHVCRCIGCGQANQTGGEPPHCSNCLQCVVINENEQNTPGYPLPTDDWVQQMSIPYIDPNGVGVPQDASLPVNWSNASPDDWSALDMQDYVPTRPSCCGDGGYSSDEHLPIPSLSRSRSPSSSDESTHWSQPPSSSGGHYYGLEPFYGYGESQQASGSSRAWF